MARFRGSTLHMRADSRDVAFGTDVRALLSTAGADTNFTVTFTTTTQITQTVDPFTNISNQPADNRVNLGWAMNQNDASTDSMGSGTNISGLIRLRVIPAGTWSFQFAWTANAPALLATRPVIISYHVYRVGANGGTRSLLFSASAASTTGNSGNGAATSSQPEYIFFENETLHVAVQITSQSTQSVLGGNTNTTVTCTFATSGTHFVTFPAMRDLFLDTSSAVGSGVGARSQKTTKDRSISHLDGVGAYDEVQTLFRSFNATGDGLGARTQKTAKDRSIAHLDGVGFRSNAVFKDLISANGAGVGARTQKTTKDNSISHLDGVGEFARLQQLLREFDAVGNGEVDLVRTVIFVRDFMATGVSVVRPRIELDFDELPDPGGGGVIINNYRPLFVFDD